MPLSIPGLLSLGVLTGSTDGGGVAAGDPAGHLGFAHSRASVADVVVGLGSLAIDAIETQCTSNGNGSSGFTEIVGGVLGGNPLLGSPAANTSIVLPGILEVTLNEQTISNAIGSTSIQVRGAHITVLPGLGSLLGVVEIILAESNCAATGPDVNVAPTTTTTTTTAPPTTTTTTTVPPTTTTTTVPPTTTTTTTVAPTTTTTTTTTIPGATTTTTTAPATTTTTTAPATTTTTVAVTTTAAPATTTTTIAPAATTTTSTTVAPVVTVPPAGSTLATTTTSTTRPPTVVTPPLARTGSNLAPLVGLALLAIALGAVVRRTEHTFTPVAYAAPEPTAPPVAPEFRPLATPPAVTYNRSVLSPLDPATAEALSAFDDGGGSGGAPEPEPDPGGGG